MVSGGALSQQRGEIFLDARGDERALRLSWHHERSVVVLSLWRGGPEGDACVGTFRLPVSEVPALIQFLVEGLAGTPAQDWPQVG